MIIDSHHHMSREKDYADRLAEECGKLGVSSVWIMACPDYYQDCAGNAAVEEALKKYPDLLVGFAYFDLGNEEPGKIDEYLDRGFRGLKMINPPLDYDDRKFYPVYERAEERGVPLLFHLGIVARDDRNKDRDINCNRMRPIYLDTIARKFTGLTIIGAHLGNPWYEEATMSARWNPNLYFDLSGSTLKKKTPEFLGGLLWWTPTTRYKDPQGRHAWEKIVFGSDVSIDRMKIVLDDYRKVMDALELSPELQSAVLGGTASRLIR